MIGWAKATTSAVIVREQGAVGEFAETVGWTLDGSVLTPREVASDSVESAPSLGGWDEDPSTRV